MNVKVFLTIFITVLFAELGDKTQAALVVASALAVVIGNTLGKYINPKYLAWTAGLGFIVIGIWTLFKA
jgi:putative Ca2+/H+ antiporter (TMEM165/GDT1 family)